MGMVRAMLVLRVLATASLVIATAACAKGTTGAIGSGGSDGGNGGSTPATGTMAGTMSAGGSPATGGGSPASTGSGMGGSGGTGGTGGASSSSATATSSSTGTGGTCAGSHLLISQIQSRGDDGGNDDFIELFNPTSTQVTLDDTWELLARAQDGPSYASRWKGDGGHIPAHGHYLLVGSGYPTHPVVAKDGDLTSGIRDASSVLLQHGGSDVDYACYGFSGANTFGGTFKCHGAAADNAPHDDTTGGTSNSDVSIERKNGGCAETGSDAADFVTTSPAAPHNHAN